jgi:hypothetical protein
MPIPFILIADTSRVSQRMSQRMSKEVAVHVKFWIDLTGSS